jgi:transposase-like protein
MARTTQSESTEQAATAICTRCTKRKSVASFYRDKSTKPGHSPWCKSCEREYNREYRARLKEAGVEKPTAAPKVKRQPAKAKIVAKAKPRSRKRTAKAA